MKHLCGACLVAIGLGFSSSTALAAPITVTNGGSTAWILLPNSIGNGGAGTWGLPADLNSIGCGNENETSCEPTGTFLISDTFEDPSGFATINDPTGAQSDLITYDNLGPGGVGRIQFFSDPNPDSTSTGTGTNLGVICTEPCFGTFTLKTANGTLITISAASDDEDVFDPFGYGFDTSDQIRFAGEGVIVGTDVPEPASLTLLGLGLAGMSARRWRRRKT